VCSAGRCICVVEGRNRYSRRDGTDHRCAVDGNGKPTPSKRFCPLCLVLLGIDLTVRRPSASSRDTSGHKSPHVQHPGVHMLEPLRLIHTMVSSGCSGFYSLCGGRGRRSSPHHAGIRPNVTTLPVEHVDTSIFRVTFHGGAILVQRSLMAWSPAVLLALPPSASTGVSPVKNGH
jgi:hypothetical protein